MESVKIDGNHLTIEEIIAVARNGAYVELAPEAKVAINQSRSWVEEIIQSGKPVYGINTGFGVFSDIQISAEDLAQLSRNLILATRLAREIACQMKSSERRSWFGQTHWQKDIQVFVWNLLKPS